MDSCVQAVEVSAPLREMRALCALKLLASTYRELRTRYEVRRSNSADQAQRAKHSVRRIMLSASSAQICWSSPLAAQLGTAYSRGARSGGRGFLLSLAKVTAGLGGWRGRVARQWRVPISSPLASLRRSGAQTFQLAAHRALSMIMPPSGVRLYPVRNCSSLLARNRTTGAMCRWPPGSPSLDLFVLRSEIVVGRG